MPKFFDSTRARLAANISTLLKSAPRLEMHLRNTVRRLQLRPLVDVHGEERRHFSAIPPHLRISGAIPEDILDQARSGSRRPEVSILILSKGSREALDNLIKSIQLRTGTVPYEILVLDKSGARPQAGLEHTREDGVRILPLPANMLDGDAFNIGVETSRAETVTLLLEESCVEAMWLTPLIRALQDRPGTGLALSSADRQANTRQPPLHGAATLKRSLYIDMLGFDWRGEIIGNGEAVLAAKLKQIGLTQTIVAESTVCHFGRNPEQRRAPQTQQAVRYSTSNTAWLDDIACSKKRFGRTIAVYFPFQFLPGGGEKFALSIVAQLAEEFDVVLVFEDRPSLLRIMAVMSALGFDKLSVACETWSEAQAHAPFDSFVLLGNTLFPERRGLGKRNYYVCQFPFPYPRNSAPEPDRLRSNVHDYERIITYSRFVEARVISGLEANAIAASHVCIVSPTFDSLEDRAGTPKLDQAVGVGRFFVGGHDKRHDIMIDAAKLIHKLHRDLPFKLIIAGASYSERKHREHLEKLQTSSSGYPIEFFVDVDRETLNLLYLQSKVYYHTSGWQVDLEVHPERAEHFGITILEAMSAGCIPIVYPAGGPAEIVEHGVNGFHARDVDSLAQITLKILREWNSPELTKIRENAAQTARRYGKDNFRKTVLGLFA